MDLNAEDPNGGCLSFEVALVDTEKRPVYQRIATKAPTSASPASATE